MSEVEVPVSVSSVSNLVSAEPFNKMVSLFCCCYIQNTPNYYAPRPTKGFHFRNRLFDSCFKVSASCAVLEMENGSRRKKWKGASSERDKGRKGYTKSN
jgi:hypothetical protein